MSEPCFCPRCGRQEEDYLMQDIQGREDYHKVCFACAEQIRKRRIEEWDGKYL